MWLKLGRGNYSSGTFHGAIQSKLNKLHLNSDSDISFYYIKTILTIPKEAKGISKNMKL